MTSLDYLIILWYFNINSEDITKVENIIFNDTMKAFGLKQLVQGATHRLGSMLNPTGKWSQSYQHHQAWIYIISLHGFNRSPSS